MKSRRRGRDRWRNRSARKTTVPFSRATITRSRPAKSRSIWRARALTRSASCFSEMRTDSISLRQWAGGFWGRSGMSLNMFGIPVVLDRVAGFLALEIHFVLLDVGRKDIVRAHPEHLRHGDEKMEQVHHFDARVLFIEFLVFGPPFPRHAVGQFRQFLAHGAGVIQNPFRLVRLAHALHLHADARVQGFL